MASHVSSEPDFLCFFYAIILNSSIVVGDAATNSNW